MAKKSRYCLHCRRTITDAQAARGEFVATPFGTMCPECARRHADPEVVVPSIPKTEPRPELKVGPEPEPRTRTAHATPEPSPEPVDPAPSPTAGPEPSQAPGHAAPHVAQASACGRSPTSESEPRTPPSPPSTREAQSPPASSGATGGLKDVRPPAPPPPPKPEPKPEPVVAPPAPSPEPEVAPQPPATPLPAIDARPQTAPLTPDPSPLLSSIQQELEAIRRVLLFEKTSPWNVLAVVVQCVAACVFAIAVIQWQENPQNLLLAALVMQVMALTFFVKGK